jgi:hypothetical protein
MPRYDFKNLETGEIKEYVFSHTEYDQFKLDNPHLERYFTTENLHVMSDGERLSVPGTGRADSSFEKYVIQPMMERVGQNTMKEGHKHHVGKEW